MTRVLTKLLLTSLLLTAVGCHHKKKPEAPAEPPAAPMSPPAPTTPDLPAPVRGPSPG